MTAPETQQSANEVSSAAPDSFTGQVGTVLEMIKFAHSIFALPFALIAAAWAADGIPHWGKLVLVVVCMVAARTVAMTFNRIADARIDARNPRTAGRALPAGIVSRSFAIGFAVIAAAVFILACAGFQYWYDNPWPVRLAVPVLVFLCVYSLTKRFTWASHVFLGAALGLAPVAAWIAVSPQTLDWAAVALGAAVVFWTVGFDIIYACQDIDIDRRERLYSIPSRFGVGVALAMSSVAHVAAVALLVLAGVLVGAGVVYYAGLVLAAGVLVWEHRLVSPRDLSRINAAFLTANGCISVVMAVFAIADILINRP